jgi:hypothetical protein
LALDGENPDGERLLPGESMTSASPEEAVHWIAVYSELVRFLLAAEQPFAPALAARYQRRLDYWVGKLQEHTE